MRWTTRSPAPLPRDRLLSGPRTAPKANTSGSPTPWEHSRSPAGYSSRSSSPASPDSYAKPEPVWWFRYRPAALSIGSCSAKGVAFVGPDTAEVCQVPVGALDQPEADP